MHAHRQVSLGVELLGKHPHTISKESTAVLSKTLRKWVEAERSLELNYLRQILEEDPPKGRLDRAALELATIDTPDLAPEPILDRLNELAANLGDRLRNFNDGREFVTEKAQSLFVRRTRLSWQRTGFLRFA